MKKVVIFGNQAVAHLIYFELTHNSPYDVVGFAVDREYIQSTELFGLPVVPFDEVTYHFPPSQAKMYIAVGYINGNKVRQEKYLHSKRLGYEFINVICNSAITYPDLEIGENCFIGHHTIIYNNVKIGNNVVVGSGCTLDHDLTLADNCFLSDRVAVSGYVSIKENCFLGTNSTIRNKVVIGRETIISAAAHIMTDTEERSVYICEPAQKLSITSDRLKIV